MDANSEAIEAWNTVLFAKWERFKALMTRGLSIHGQEALRRHAPAKGSRVLDIGCGYGDSTQQIARLVGDRGEAIGVDAAANFIDAARRDAEIAGVKNARFSTVDVQTEALGGPYDSAFSRFGTMFFSSPVAALRNVRLSLAPGGRLTMVVWRRREDNPWLYAAELKVREIVPEVENEDEPTCGPGPFSMAGPDMVSDQLMAAGYTHICFERFDGDIMIGRDLEDAVEFALALGPAGEIMRLAGAEGERLKPNVIESLRDVLAQFVREGGVYAPSSTWLISARAA
jgi:ubiquinone/menaquinone biosynthesis C-methylase UbiE